MSRVINGVVKYVLVVRQSLEHKQYGDDVNIVEQCLGIILAYQAHLTKITAIKMLPIPGPHYAH